MGIFSKFKAVISSSSSSSSSSSTNHDIPSPSSSSSAHHPEPRTKPRTPTGRRKPRSTPSRRPHLQQANRKTTDPKPSDYLYFGGDGDSSAVSAPHSGVKPSGAGASSSTSSVQSGSTSSSTSSSSGRDDSGFLATGVRTQQPGYQGVTNGGSLQYDYAQTQPGL